MMCFAASQHFRILVCWSHPSLEYTAVCELLELRWKLSCSCFVSRVYCKFHCMCACRDTLKRSRHFVMHHSRAIKMAVDAHEFSNVQPYALTPAAALPQQSPPSLRGHR